MERPRQPSILLGAVAYDKKVVDIWEGMRSYFRDERGLDLEVVLFLNYEAQAQALVEGRIDIAWNTNLAYLQCEAWSGGTTDALAMRDTDLGWTTKIIAPAGGQVRTLDDLRNKTLALGSRDSGHAAILPVHFLAQQGMVEGTDYKTLRFDLDVGKHGDTGTSEKDVLQAVLDGRAQAGAVGSPFWDAVVRDRLVPTGSVEVVYTTPAYNHCMFTARDGFPDAQAKSFTDALFAMSWDDPRHRPILEAEGLRAWVPPALDGYGSLREAGGKQGFFDPQRARIVVKR